MKQATLLWKWEIPNTHPNKWIGIYNRETSPDRFGFQYGKRVENLESVPSFSFTTTLSRLQKFDVLPNNAGSPLVSLKVVEILTDICPDSVQFINAEVQTEDGLLEGFCLLNITQLFASIDLEKSSYRLMTGSKYIASFQKRIHKLEGIPSNLLAREDLCKSHIIVANDIFEALNSHRVKGVQFSPCEIE